MQAKAILRNAIVSPQKGRLVADMVRGKSIARALDILEFNNKKAAGIIKKVLNSAIANAENNEGADVDELRIETICIDEGPMMKRWHARAKGRGVRIIKRTSHIRIVVGDSKGSK